MNPQWWGVLAFVVVALCLAVWAALFMRWGKR
jgi:hypothetical protein